MFVPEEKLVQYNINLRDIASLINEEARSDPAGDLSSGVARLKTGIEKKSIKVKQNAV